MASVLVQAPLWPAYVQWRKLWSVVEMYLRISYAVLRAGLSR